MLFMVGNKISAKNWEIHLNMFFVDVLCRLAHMKPVESCVVTARCFGLWVLSVQVWTFST